MRCEEEEIGRPGSTPTRLSSALLPAFIYLLIADFHDGRKVTHAGAGGGGRGRDPRDVTNLRGRGLMQWRVLVLASGDAHLLGTKAPSLPEPNGVREEGFQTEEGLSCLPAYLPTYLPAFCTRI